MKTDLNLLAVFDAVYKARNVTAAAQQLGVSQSTVSSALNRMRHVFGDDLFVRARYGVIPTARADAMAEETARIIADAQKLFEPQQPFDPATSDRTFTIAASTYFETILIPDLMRRVAEEAPGITLRVVPQGAELDTNALLSGDLDLALGRFEDADDRFVRRKLLEDGFSCLGRVEDFPGRTYVLKEEFERMPHVTVTPPGRWQTGVFKALEEVGLSRNVTLSVSHFLAVGPALKAVGGLATLPDRIATLIAQEPGLVKLDTPTPLTGFPMIVAWHPRFRRDPGHRWIRDLIAQLCAET